MTDPESWKMIKSHLQTSQLNLSINIVGHFDVDITLFIRYYYIINAYMVLSTVA